MGWDPGSRTERSKDFASENRFLILLSRIVALTSLHQPRPTLLVQLQQEKHGGKQDVYCTGTDVSSTAELDTR